MNETHVDPENVGELPTRPGVYLMKDAAGKVIYVGKAANLRSRVRSYFQATGDERLSVPFLRGRVRAIDTIVTDTEKEALLLENTLIKKHKPRYNIRLRDDKTYISLRFDTAHQWPRVHRARRRRPGDKAMYFGPYASSKAVNETLRFLQRLFPIRSCTDHELATRVRPCILHQIDRCSAPCVGSVERETYDEYVRKSLLFLKGKRSDVERLLTEKMEEYSEALQFEKAAMVRDRLVAARRTVEEEKVHSHRMFDRDVIAFARGGGRVAFGVLNFKAGRLDDSRVFDVRDTGADDETLAEEFLSQYYDTTRPVPLDVLLSHEPANREFLEAMLAKQRESGTPRLRVPARGGKKRLVEMAMQNAQAAHERVLSGKRSVEETLRNLQESLRLPRLPRHVECFDISNFQASFPVGSMTSFRDAEPDKAGYRRFKIRGVAGQNDFAMMKEVLSRRYARVASGEEEPPDLVVIDGGMGQLNVAVEAIAQLGLTGKFPVVGLAKARTKAGPDAPVRTEERVFLPGRKNPVTFGRADPALHLLERARDETHRFGVAYHRLLRSKSALRTGLEEIPGIGPKRRGLLLKHLGSLNAVKGATVDQLAAVPGVPREAAEAVHRFFHPPDEVPKPEDDDATIA